MTDKDNSQESPSSGRQRKPSKVLSWGGWAGIGALAAVIAVLIAIIDESPRDNGTDNGTPSAPRFLHTSQTWIPELRRAT